VSTYCVSERRRSFRVDGNNGESSCRGLDEQLQVINSGEVPVLLIDGVEIVGGRQNRVVNTTVLVPAQSAFELVFTCV